MLLTKVTVSAPGSVWQSTSSPSHGENTGSNRSSRANSIKYLVNRNIAAVCSAAVQRQSQSMSGLLVRSIRVTRQVAAMFSPIANRRRKTARSEILQSNLRHAPSGALSLHRAASPADDRTRKPITGKGSHCPPQTGGSAPGHERLGRHNRQKVGRRPLRPGVTKTREWPENFFWRFSKTGLARYPRLDLSIWHFSKSGAWSGMLITPDSTGSPYGLKCGIAAQVTLDHVPLDGAASTSCWRGESKTSFKSRSRK
jgi:hypothetical protein